MKSVLPFYSEEYDYTIIDACDIMYWKSMIRFIFLWGNNSLCDLEQWCTRIPPYGQQF